MLHNAKLEWVDTLATHTLVYWANSKATKKKNCCEYGPWSFIHNTLFQAIVMHNAGWKGLQLTNNLAYWAHSKVMKKLNCREYSPSSCIPS